MFLDCRFREVSGCSLFRRRISKIGGGLFALRTLRNEAGTFLRRNPTSSACSSDRSGTKTEDKNRLFFFGPKSEDIRWRDLMHSGQVEDGFGPTS